VPNAYHEACESSLVNALACGDHAAGDPAHFGGRVAIRGRAPGVGASPRQARGARLRAAQQPARLPPGIASVLSVLSSSAVVLDSNDRVLRASAAARAFGMVKGDRLMVTELAALARQVRRDGEIREGEIEVSGTKFGGRTTSFAVRVAPLGSGVGGGGLVLLLAEDQTESRRVEEVRRDFVANVSHELKTPMGALGLLAETLVAEPDPDVAQRLAGRIHNEAFRVSRIIDDLLDLSRIESEEAPPREPVLVNLVMADAIERVRATADQRGIEIVLHEPSPPVAVLGDRRQLVSAMHALLENAITYSYDNSKVVVTGAVQRFNPNLSHPSIAGHLVDVREFSRN